MTNAEKQATETYEMLFNRGRPIGKPESPGDREDDPTIAHAVALARNLGIGTTPSGHDFGLGD